MGAGELGKVWVLQTRNRTPGGRPNFFHAHPSVFRAGDDGYMTARFGVGRVVFFFFRGGAAATKPGGR